jgi:hypothetical protein
MAANMANQFDRAARARVVGIAHSAYSVFFCREDPMLSWLTPQEWRRFWRIILVQVLVGLGLLALLIWYVHQGNDLGIIRQFVG